MSYFDNQYDNLLPLHPNFIQADSSADMNPTIHRQHLAPFTDRPQGYYSVPPQQQSQDEFMGHPSRLPKVNTFSLENMIYNMSSQINYLFYMNILILILLVIVVMGVVISVLNMGALNRSRA